MSCAGRHLFRSGIAIANSKTAKLQEFEYNGITYTDAPGFWDVRLRRALADEIESALRKGGNFKVGGNEGFLF